MNSKLDGYLNFQQTTISLLARRQEVLASNIANADTPNYKARDFDFNAVLAKKLKSANNTTASTDALGADLLYRQVIQPSADGNTVDMDVERNLFAENSLRYETSVTMITGQVKDMLAVLQG
ncbi:flagellar basal body rod protein FlgB [Candidatus Methylospira mobilis]|uniref:Flagellar basal body rod protein FlgB n=1 Tax=Candidatus Methylospira mobilis TaxID=1808979 RepID=A0A5Q0BJR3_9GAMM|nr:flagellar basal body rod protein FlgB [Candidatus Methylospira mobilis]QFY42424.1 flagellar basal body rod protein FlgB [Candidatus Methylospira mobilis]WNV04474.1 flagellar basal body rod protein FlgB [Candidatus Methylospira mobilis]